MRVRTEKEKILVYCSAILFVCRFTSRVRDPQFVLKTHERIFSVRASARTCRMRHAVRAFLVLSVWTRAGWCSASHADLPDSSSSSSSSFQAARHPGLRLGFVRSSGAAGELLGRAHVDKLGGLPSWPYPYPPECMQTPECLSCGEGMPFVLSVVQPSVPMAEREDCLHVFACRGSACARSNLAARVFRSQRPLPVSDSCPGQPPLCRAPTLVLREKALDFEDFSDEDGLLAGDEHIDQLLTSYQAENKDGSDGDAGCDDDVNVEDTKFDQIQIAFSSRIAAAPAQVVRYYSNVDHQGAGPMDTGDAVTVRDPLWVGGRGRMAGQPPPCEKCAGKRRLEMQVMPQILNFVEVPEEDAAGNPRSGGGSGAEKEGLGKYDTFQLQMDMDWGTIVAFVCEARCDLLSDCTGSGFCEEFAWRQPGLDSDSNGNIDALLKQPGDQAKRGKGRGKGKRR